MATSQPPPPPAPCPLCRTLREKEHIATARGNHSLATDCRVLIARHPHTARTGAAQ